MGAAAAGQEYDFEIPLADPAPVIDGEIDDVWLKASVQVIDEMDEPVGETPTSLEDCSGYFRVLYDPEYLYVLVDVNDSDLFNDSELANSWRDDSVEFYFDGNNSKTEQGDLDENDFQYRFGWNVEATFDAFEFFVGAPAMEGMTYKMAETEDGYLFEIAFPWATLMGGTIPHGTVIGIDCFINDDDTGGDNRQTQLSWHATAGTGWNTPGQWGTAWIPPLMMATNPDPADGAVNVNVPLLRWDAGHDAVMRNVYLGTSPDLGPDHLVAANSPMLMYFYPTGFEPGVTYYWRVDEIQSDGVTITTGDVWSFTTPPIKAHTPNPPAGAKWIDPEEVLLSWGIGSTAQVHELYFGTNEADVAAGAESVAKGTLALPEFEAGALAEATTYYWRVDEVEASGAVQVGDVWAFTTKGPDGGGVKGEYFGNQTLSGLPVMTRVDDAIDFEWGAGGPGSGLGEDDFSVRWTAELEVAFDEVYTFHMNTTDGGKLVIDGQVIINQWQDQRDPTEASGQVALSPDVRYSLVMEYYENTGDAVAQLFWESPSQPRQIVPAGPLQLPMRAAIPYPAAHAVDVPQSLTMRWSPGDVAAEHQVYFGQDKDAVADATPATAGIYKGQQTLDNTTFNPGPLEWDTMYFWRVDEVNNTSADSPWTGSVWSFTTANFLVIDNFESYTNEVGERPFEVWVDGIGFSQPEPGNAGNGTTAAVGHDIWSVDSPYYNGQLMETRLVHGDKQSMPVDYNNLNQPYYAEVERTWAMVQDLTVNAVDTLVIYVRGQASNGADRLYVALEDTAGRVAVAMHSDPEAVAKGKWSEWATPLSVFTDAGVDVTAVRTMYIGTGDRNAPAMGGAGTFYLDDIRVIKSEPTQ
jgi:predicted RecA/RadA family phage recombinase